MSNILTNIEKIFVGCDHAGFALKSELIKKTKLSEISNVGSSLAFQDMGTFNDQSVDYPDYADQVVNAMNQFGREKCVGLLICGSGQGMAIRANRFSYIRAALCWSVEVAKLARAHNNANVLCLPGKSLNLSQAEEILKAFLTTPFEGGRHDRRVEKLSGTQ